MTLRLHDIHDLFVPPSQNPFQENYMPLAGIDQIALHLKLARLNQGVHVTFVLPAGAGQPDDLERDIKAGLKRYCDNALTHLGIEVEAKGRNVIRNLQVGVIILGVSLALAAAISNASFLADWLRNLLSNSISIFGSVALWSPADAFLFGMRPIYKEVRIYKAISRMTFDIQVGVDEHST